MSIDIRTYNPLNSFAVLASTGIGSTNGTTTVAVGSSYGSSDSSYNDISGNKAPNGVITAAQINLTQLISDINTLYSLSPAPLFTNGGSGTITYNPGKYQSGPAGIIYDASSTIIFDASSNSSAQFFIKSNNKIQFNSVTNIILINGAQTNNIFWFGNGGVSGPITFTGTSPIQIPGIFIANNSSISIASQSNTFGRLYSKGRSVSFSGGSFINGANQINIVCYVKGSLILTKQGYVPIENIKEGDKILTKGKIYNNEFIRNDANLKNETVIWVGKFKIGLLDSKSAPICIKKDSFGENKPFQDLYVSPNHRLLLNEKMSLAHTIVNGTTIYQDFSSRDIDYYHLECEHHSAIFANGILAESFLNLDIKSEFEKA